MDPIIVIAILACVFAVAALLGWRLLDTVQGLVARSQQVTEICLTQMQQNHSNVTHKLEVWHEQSDTAQRAQLERVVEKALARSEELSQIAARHGMERDEEGKTRATQITNERAADMQEAVAGKIQAPVRTPVERSEASLSRDRLAEGRIPTR